ncbi:CMRF35-like molecule 5 isoform X3 [Sphaeramia orbicularis]|uniref:CMRF35-like molecule 5 isoform X3 n=1 Tax=Sphaeramia orbicularis TaxID=375764 RepID=UPI00117E4324|nr:CMRF35-like molecule 5 isoform X3 [Sphaeramia orbicularis]
MFFEAFLFLLRSNAQMWRFQKLLFTFCFVLDSDIGAAQLIDVSGYEGRNVNISCSYEYGYDTYEKYLCRNDCGDADVLITTTEVQKNRYSITDDTSVRVFTVTISQLSAADAGKYWCGISKSFTDIYTEVKLNVKPDSCCDSVTIIQSSLENSVSISCPYKSEFLNSLKYICRGKQPSVCLQQAVVTSVNKLNRRFGLQDDKTSRHFTVTVTDVTKDDAGSYLCGVQRNNHLDEFNHIQLEVKVSTQTNSLPPMTTVETTGIQSTHVPGQINRDPVLFYGMVFIGVALPLMLILPLIIFIKWKCFKAQGAGNSTKTVDAKEATSMSDIYENDEVVVNVKLNSSKPQSSRQHCDAQQETVYQNFDTEDTYCNQYYHKDNKH